MGKSLYRLTLLNDAGTLTPTSQEMVQGVTDMTLRYLQAGQSQFVAADALEGSDWTKVTAVQVSLTLQNASQRAGAGAQPLSRVYTTTIALYNRLN